MIKVMDNYYIDAEPSPPHFILRRRYMTKPKNGGEPKERFTVEGYYSTVKGALRGLAKQISADTIIDGSYSLGDALNRIEAKWSDICSAIDGKSIRIGE